MSERYQIKEKIGEGGLGEVFIALDTQLQREVALKRVRPGPGQSPDDVLKEAQVLSALQHPNILTVFDVGRDTGGPFIISELLRGETLEKVIERAPLQYEDFLSMAQQSLEGLVAAHALSLVHRDLKPGNLMVTWLASGKFQIKILDFGLAKFSEKASRQTENQDESVMGSIYYMAPEQFERLPLDARTDLYAMGCIFYFALTGHNPFEGETAPVVMASHLEHRVFPLDKMRPDLPPWLCTWIMWFINRLPGDRPASAQQALDLFHEHAKAWEAAQAVASAKTAPIRPHGRPVVVQPPGRASVLPAAHGPASPRRASSARTAGKKKGKAASRRRQRPVWPLYLAISLATIGLIYGLLEWNKGQSGGSAGSGELTLEDIVIPEPAPPAPQPPGQTGGSTPADSPPPERAAIPERPPGTPSIPVAAGETRLSSDQARIIGSGARRRSSISAIGFWQNPATSIVWDLEIAEPGSYEIVLSHSTDDRRMGGRYAVSLAGQQLTGEITAADTSGAFVETSLGSVTVEKSGPATLEIRPLAITGKSLMNVSGITLRKE